MFIDGEIYKAFYQLRKQIYKLKTTKGYDKYTKIEDYRNTFITFKRFCNAVDNCYAFLDYDSIPTTQEVLEFCMDNTKYIKKISGS